MPTANVAGEDVRKSAPFVTSRKSNLTTRVSAAPAKSIKMSWGWNLIAKGKSKKAKVEKLSPFSCFINVSIVIFGNN
jgi:hypothetical protein